MKFLKLTLLFCALLAFSCQRSVQEDPLVCIQIQDRNGLSETISVPERLAPYREVDFLSSQPFKKVLRVYKKEGKNHSIITTYHPNGLPWQYLEAQDMRAFGLYREWFSTGQLKIEAHVIGGTADVHLGSQSDWLFDQESRVWDEQGHLIALIPYQKGALEGTNQNFYPDGKIKQEIPYRQNLIEGDWTQYYPDGKIKEQTYYQLGIKQGKSTGYFPDGTCSWREEYKNDLLETGLYFNPKGEKLSSVEKGTGFQTFFEESLAYQKIEIRKGKQEGMIQEYTSEGDLRRVYHMKNGKKQGEELVYYLPSELEHPTSTPTLKFLITWEDEKIHGPVKTWYPNGSLESQKEWARNRKNGTCCSWYRDGSLMLIEEYEEDLLTQGRYFKRAMKDPVSTLSQGNGIATLYDDQGVFLRKVIYMKGKPIDPED